MAAILAAVALAAATSANAADLGKDVADVRAKYAADIERLSNWCKANGLADEARRTRCVLGPNDRYKLFIAVLPEQVGPPALPADAPAKATEWDSQLWRVRRDQAAKLYELARRAAHEGRVSVAIELARWALEANPDCEPARRLFGYQKVGDQWRTAYEARKLRSGFVWSDQFGWLPKTSLPRYERGERLCDGRWISAAEDARRHADIRTGWKVETEHYAIRTDLGIEAAVALGVKLESLQRIWQQLFVRYYATNAEVVAMFEGRSRSKLNALPRHAIVYFRDREEYARQLRPTMPQVDRTTGVYRDDPPCAYFFAGEGASQRDVYHEATHQLFYESRAVSPDLVRRENFWVVEGIALFMESLRREDGFWVLGGVDDERMRAARYRLLHDNFYVPLEQLIAFDMKKLQQDPRIAMLYSQSAGLTHFLAFDGGSRYRDALVAYLVAVYSGRAGRDTLAKLTGQSDAELDRQYRTFVEAGRAEAKND
ncbi:MAG: DUF1570 domain-containing protein [Thermoguttaceae bacterium]